jgi:hypothetical protein
MTMTEPSEVVLYLPERGALTPSGSRSKRINHFLLAKTCQLSDGTHLLQRTKGTQDYLLTMPSGSASSTLTIQGTYTFAHDGTVPTYGEHAVRDISHVFSIKRVGATAALTVLEIDDLGAILGGGIRTNMNVIFAPSGGRSDGVLAPFVARQLVDLAILRHEQCPITIEDYVVGHTAVLPCGHLFARAALEECFKKDADTCPACRAKGRPTYA